jgi:hypothetical protein
MKTNGIEVIPKESEEFTLPSGCVCHIRAATGRDLHTAMKICGQDTDFIPPALASVLCTFAGAARNMDEILDMPLSDYQVILEKVGEVLVGN